MELWKDIPGYPGYQASSLGNIKGVFGRILKPWKSRGYDIVWVCPGDGTKRKCGVHRLIGMAFLDNPENKPTIDHLNRVRTDNRLENLRWATHTEQRLTSPVPISDTGERNINITSNGKYRFIVRRNNKVLVNETYDNFQEAIEAKRNFLEELTI